MSSAVFPHQLHGFTWTINRTSEGATIIQRSPGLNEVRIAQTVNPIWHWSLVYDYLYDLNTATGFKSSNNTLPYTPWSDVEELIGFILARQSAYDDFLFTDPSLPNPCSIGPGITGSSTPNPRAALQLVTDGSFYYSPIQKLWGGQFYEDVTDLNPANTITVYANGSLTTNYTLHSGGLAIAGYSFAGMYLKWNAMPTAPITATFNFYYRSRLESDKQDIEQFLAGLWTIGGAGAKQGSGKLLIMSARPAAA